MKFKCKICNSELIPIGFAREGPFPLFVRRTGSSINGKYKYECEKCNKIFILECNGDIIKVLNKR